MDASESSINMKRTAFRPDRIFAGIVERMAAEADGPTSNQGGGVGTGSILDALQLAARRSKLRRRTAENVDSRLRRLGRGLPVRMGSAMVAVVSDELEDWFRQEVLPYERALMQYLSQKQGLRADAEDLRNEIYIRILESAARAKPAVPKAFLFSTARNLLIDLARRNRVVAIDLLEDLDVLNVLIDEISPERQVSGRQQLQRISRIFDRLPEKCRGVLWLRRIEGLSQREVAQRQGITEAMVAKHVYRGLRYLAGALYEGREKADPAPLRAMEMEPNHGE